MLIDLPEHIAARTANLGEPIAQFETSRVQTLLCLIVSGPLALLGMAGCVACILLWNDPTFGGIVTGKVFLVGVLTIITGVGLWFRWQTLRGTGVIVFTKGISRYDRVMCEVMNWEWIQQIHRGIAEVDRELTMVTPARLTLTDSFGREWVFNEALTGLKEFRAIAEEHTMPYLLPTALEALKQGQSLAFGPIGLTRAGIISPLLAWEDITDAGVQAGKIFVRSSLGKGKHLEARLYEVPNVHVFLALIDRFRGLQCI